MSPTARDTGWFKSTRSATANDTCVEVRIIAGTAIGIRDSKHPDGGTLWITPNTWTSFIAQTKTFL